MNSTQLKLDKFLTRDDPSSRPVLACNSNSLQVMDLGCSRADQSETIFSQSFVGHHDGKMPSLPDSSGRWRPNQRPFVLPPMTKNSIGTTSMRTIQLIDPIMAPSAPISTLKHIQSAQNLFSIGKRMPEIEIALKQLVSNMETCPRAEEEAPQPLTLRNVTLHGYQRHALAWMQWREMNPPFGGLEDACFSNDNWVFV